MLPSPRTSSATRVASLTLSLALLATLCSPLAPRSAAAVGTAAPSPRAANTTAQAGRQPAARDGELLVRFRQGTTEAEKDAAVGSRGARRGRGLKGGSAFERIELPQGQTPEAAASNLRSAPEVEFAEPNFLVKGEQAAVNDPRFSEQWALQNTGQQGGNGGSDIGAPGAWSQTTGSAQTVVAVIDSGIDFTHPDLKNNEWANPSERENGRDDDHDGYVDDLHGWDFVAGSNQITDPNGHGTAVAGIIAAEGNNGVGTSGVMWRASMMSLRVLDNTGTGDIASAVEAIDYAAAHGAKIINLSWGTDGESLALKDAITRAASQGVIVVCSAGNSGRNIDGTPYYPASYDLPNTIAVAATSNLDQMTAWSNWGARGVAVAAPGDNILTTRAGGDYSTLSGTSAAAPLVSGVAGLVKTLRPDLGPSAVKSAITDGARKVAGLGGVVASGGVASAQGALAASATLPVGSGSVGSNGSSGGNGNSGNGQGGGNGGANGQGNGNGGSQRLGQPPPPEHGRGGHGPNGSFDTTPSLPTKQAPPGFGNQDVIRKSKAVEPKPPTLIHAADVMPLCDVSCGGDVPPNAGGSDPYFATARTRPANRTGTARPTSVVGAGEDTGSMDVNWGLPLVQLQGRAGLDLGIGIYYNSLVWSKQDTSVQFDPDHGFPGPGFRLGFPVLQPVNYNYDDGSYSYMLVTPTGGRVEMRQTGTAGVYESADSSYTQLVENSDGTRTVRTTDGTQLLFAYNATVGEYRCAQIKDRNGNYITVNYGAINGNTTLGRPTSVVDTLGRVVSFNYDSQNYLSSITQSWHRETASGPVTETHTWANFSYGALTVQTNFPGLAVYGPANGQTIPVLTQVGLPDGTSYAFDYNTYGQVYRIRRVAPDGHTLAQSTYNLPLDASAAQTDCPRFSQRRDWAEYWNGDNGDRVVASSEEAVTDYGVYQNVTWTRPDGYQFTGTLTQVSSPVFYDKDGVPRRIVQNTYTYSAPGQWYDSLTGLEETYDLNVNTQAYTKQRWVMLYWTQDDTTLSYQKNPRVVETNIYDSGGNRKRTVTDYTSYGLPSVVYEYASDAQTLLRRTTIDYRWDDAWISRRIIGLVDVREVFEGDGTLASKVSYGYDFGGDFNFQDTPAPATQHDRANYGPSFLYGRGNVSSILRWDATDPDNSSKWTEVKIRRSTTGDPLMVLDPNWHATYYDYADNYSDGAARNTYAYPTTVTDPDNYPSTIQYNYDLGMIYRAVDPKGAAAHIYYDGAGRVERTVNEINNAYVRYAHDMTYGWNNSWSSVNNVADEAYTNAFVDGAGRVRGVTRGNPNSQGTYLSTLQQTDALGRVTATSNPTETNPGGTPWGDDAAGYQWTLQAYDWKGRPTLTTFPLVTGQSYSNTKELSYGGCGCAGGEVTTARDERGRKRVLTADVLGRLRQVDELNWDGSTYATTTYTYNARDQIATINQAGQTRTMEYDGYGRLWHRTTPEQGTTTYIYNPDDTVYSVTDARGASQTYGYNNRHLITGITFNTNGAAASTPNVSFGYDAAGNRTSMTDGLGSVSYTVNTLSQVTDETRTFTGVGSFTINYTYNLAGELTRVTNPWSAQAAYVYDAEGRVTDVRGTDINGNPTYASVSTYAQTLRYRAFGGLKSASYGNGKSLSLGYDQRLRLTGWGVPGVMNWGYRYDIFGENSQRATFAQNLDDPTLDRSYDYDHVGRLWVSHSGNEADGHAGITAWPSDPPSGPYSQQYGFDQFGNMNYRVGWGGVQNGYLNASQSFVNNRQQTNPWTGAALQYDGAGNLTYDGSQSFSYDVTGQQVSASGGTVGLSMAYDGDRLRVSKTEGGVTTYYLRSRVLGGQVLAELKYNPSFGGWYWDRGYVYLGSQLLAVQANGVNWVHHDPVTKSQRMTDVSGNVVTAVDLDPWGGETGRSSNSAFQPHRFTTYERDGNTGDEAMMRRYEGRWVRFSQPDPYDGSYDLSNPQSFNRYSYTQNDPVNFVDPFGLTSDCIFPNFSQLSQAQQSLLPGGATQYNNLTDSQTAGFLDTTGALAAAGISTSGLTVEDVKNDTNLDFGPSSNSAAFTSSVTAGVASGAFVSDPLTFGLHQGRTSSFDARQSVTTDSLHVGYGTAGGFAHIDGFGAYTDVVGFFGHQIEYLIHHFGHTHTDPFKVGRALGSGITGYNANCKPNDSRPSKRQPVAGGGGGGAGGGMGGGGYPSWWYSMWDFANWVDSIQVEKVTVTVVE